ncbi:MAG: RDD family protein, partial [Pedobacter sp.]
FYDLVCELTMNGQSVGKRFLKIRVISDDGAQPSLGKYLLRWLFRIIDFTFTSEACALISVAVTNKKQRLGDIVAGTIVIKTSPRTAMQDIAFIPEQEDYTPVYRDVLLLKDREIELIHEVILTYMQNRNPEIVFAMAARIKNHLNIAQMEGMHELAFLQTLIKDYNHLTSKA